MSKLETEISNPKNNNHTTISISRKNYNKLKELGHTGESFNFVLEKILAKEIGVYSIDVTGKE
jgi:predicted CopG family antitoxin